MKMIANARKSLSHGSHNAQFHKTPARSEGAVAGTPKGLLLGQGCQRVSVLYVCSEWGWQEIISFFAENFYKPLDKLRCELSCLVSFIVLSTVKVQRGKQQQQEE